MKQILTYLFIITSFLSFSQDDKKELLALNKATNYVVEANDLVNDDFIAAEMEYRKAISIKPTNVAGAYNLGHSYYKKENYDEALYRHQQAAKNAVSKDEKYRAFHNIGNILMKEKNCKEAAEAFKDALRNNPKDEETRYNFALAKDCAKNQKEDPQEKDKDGENKKDEKQDDKKDKENEEDKEDEKEDKGEDKEDEKENGDQDKKEGDDKPEDDKGKPKEEKKDDNKKGNDDKKQQPQQQPGQLSPQQIKNLLEAMNNQEQKVQEKINAKKVKGAKIKTDKDW